jgi:hypothetical protein
MDGWTEDGVGRGPVYMDMGVVRARRGRKKDIGGGSRQHGGAGLRQSRRAMRSSVIGGTDMCCAARMGGRPEGVHLQGTRWL